MFRIWIGPSFVPAAVADPLSGTNQRMDAFGQIGPCKNLENQHLIGYFRGPNFG